MKPWIDRTSHEFVEQFGFSRPLLWFERQGVSVTYVPFEHGLIHALGKALSKSEVRIVEHFTSALSLGMCGFWIFNKSIRLSKN